MRGGGGGGEDGGEDGGRKKEEEGEKGQTISNGHGTTKWMDGQGKE